MLGYSFQTKGAIMHTLEQLSAFVAVYEQGSYSSAAKILRKSRTTIREHIVAYEDVLGYDLFIIDGRKAVPTEKASLLYYRAKLVDKQNRSLYVQSQSLYDTDVHTINMCYDVITPMSLIAFIECRLAEYNPHLVINWRHRTRERAMEYLLDGTCDIALMPFRGHIYPEKEVTWTSVAKVEMACFARPNSSLAQTLSLKLEDLMLETQYVTENLASLNISFAQIQVAPKLHVVSNSDLLCELLMHNGWAAMPRHYMQPFVERGQLVELKLEEIGDGVTFGLNAFYCHGKQNIDVFHHILDWISQWQESR